MNRSYSRAGKSGRRRACLAIESLESRQLLATLSVTGSPNDVSSWPAPIVWNRFPRGQGIYLWNEMIFSGSPPSEMAVRAPNDPKTVTESKGLIDFDLSGLKDATKIDSATLNLRAPLGATGSTIHVIWYDPGSGDFSDSDFSHASGSPAADTTFVVNKGVQPPDGSLTITVDVKAALTAWLQTHQSAHLRFRLEANPGDRAGVDFWTAYPFGDSGTGATDSLDLTYDQTASTSTSVSADASIQGGSYVFPPGKPLTLTATVQAQDSGVGTPAGTVDFIVDGVNTAVPLVQGIATLSVTPTGNTDTVSAHYEGSASDLASDSSKITLVASKPTPTPSITPTPTPTPAPVPAPTPTPTPGPLPAKLPEQSSGWKSGDAVARALKAAKAHSTGKCATYVRQAIAAGGVNLARIAANGYASNYGESLEMGGFAPVYSGNTKNPVDFAPQNGDVIVIQGYPSDPTQGVKKANPAGHMAIYDVGDHIWVSDFKQTNKIHGVYPGPSYDKMTPSYKIYRK